MSAYMGSVNTRENAHTAPVGERTDAYFNTDLSQA